MNHHHKKVLESLFAHPISTNVNFKDVEHVLVELGAQITEKADNKIIVTIGERATLIHRPHNHSLTKDDVAQVRGFLIDCGIEPERL